jgi:hypothetical protein
MNTRHKGDWIMKKFKYPPDARLPFPTRIIQLPNGTIELYEIPYSMKATVLKALHPYIFKPSMEEEMYDIHADKKFIVKEFLVTREDGMNLLVSPYYFESGGTVIDWESIDDEE